MNPSPAPARVRRTWMSAAALAGAAILLATFTPAHGQERGKRPPPPPPGKRFVYEYDAAGRLVRVGDGSGRFLVYDYDASGNLTGTRTTRLWHVAVRKPDRGAWVMSLADDGTLAGHGGDESRGFFRLRGTLSFSGGAGTGSVDLVDEDTSQTLATFDLTGSTQSADGGGAPVSLSLASTNGAAGVLSAAGTLPGANFDGFSGTYANRKNFAKVGRTKSPVGLAGFVADGALAATSVLSGDVGGTLVRDVKGNAYGTVTFDGESFAVRVKLKNGAKSVRAKTGKGAPVAFQLKVRR